MYRRHDAITTLSGNTAGPRSTARRETAWDYELKPVEVHISQFTECDGNDSIHRGAIKETEEVPKTEVSQDRAIPSTHQ
jgi:hypothetical protein